MPLRISDVVRNTPALNKWADATDDRLEILERFRDRHAKLLKTLGAKTANLDLPANPSSVTVTEAPYVQDNQLYSKITCTYTAPSNLGTFAGVYLVVQGYQGQTALFKVGEDNFTGSGGGTQTFSTTLDRTGESVTFYVVPKTSNGTTGPWFDGVVVTGITLDAGIGSVSRVGFNAGSGGNMCANPGFEFNQGQFAADGQNVKAAALRYYLDSWQCIENDGNSYWAFVDSAVPYVGNNAMNLGLLDGVTLANGVTVYIVMSSDPIPVNPGELYVMKGYIRTDQSIAPPANVNRQAAIQIRWYDASGVLVSAPAGGPAINAITGAYSQYSTGPVLAPAGAVYARPSVFIGVTNSTGATQTLQNGWFGAHFDALYFGQQQQSSSTTTPATGAYTPNQASVLSQNGTATTINIANFTMSVPWNSSLSYTGGSITGLAYNTKYYVYCDDPTYQGGAVTYHQTTAAWVITQGDGRIYLGNITLSSTGGGTGGGGGGGACFSPDTRVKVRRFGFATPTAISKVRGGDLVKTTGGWRRVKQVLVHQYEDIMLDMGGGELITPEHAILQNGEWTPAVHAGLWNHKSRVWSGPVYNLTIDTENDNERNYELANGVIAHNAIK